MVLTFQKRLTNSGGLPTVAIPTWVADQMGLRVGDGVKAEVERLESGETRLTVVVTPRTAVENISA